MLTLEQKKAMGAIVETEAIITIGMYDQDTKKQEIDRDSYIAIIEQAIFDYGIFGATMFTQGVYGIFRHEDGTIIREPSIRIEICGESRETVMRLVVFLRKRLNQESIMFRFTQQVIEFVNADYTIDD